MRPLAVLAALGLCFDALLLLTDAASPVASPVSWLHCVVAALLTSVALSPSRALALAGRSHSVRHGRYDGFSAPPSAPHGQWRAGAGLLAILSALYALRVAGLAVLIVQQGSRWLFVPIVGSAAAAVVFALLLVASTSRPKPAA